MLSGWNPVPWALPVRKTPDCRARAETTGPGRFTGQITGAARPIPAERLEGACPRRYLSLMDSPASIRTRAARHRTTQRERGLRAVTLWLPDVNDPAYRARIAEECRLLSALTPDEDSMAEAFEQNAAGTPGWR